MCENVVNADFAVICFFFGLSIPLVLENDIICCCITTNSPSLAEGNIFASDLHYP